MKKTVYHLILTLLSLIYSSLSYSQGVAINSTGVNPNNSAMLDITANNRGLLIPRVALTSTTDASTISNGNVVSLLVFNTATITDVTPGYYYWDGTIWKNLGKDADSDPFNEIELPATATTGQVLSWNGTAWVAQNSASGADNWGSDVVNTSGTNIAGNGTPGSPIVVTEIDGSITNEIQDLVINTTTNILTITNNGTPNSIDLTPYLDNTDAQNLTSTATGGNATVNISNGTSTTFSINDADFDPTNEIELPTGGALGQVLSTNGTGVYSWITDNAGTDNQNITGSSFNATTGDLVIGIQNGTSQILNINGLKDHDWYKVGTTSAPTSINDDIYTQGNVGIGEIVPTYSLEIKKAIPNMVLRRTNNANDAYYAIKNSGSTEIWRMGAKGNNNFNISSANGVNDRLVVNYSTGNVGIGTVTPSAKLEVTGQVKITGGAPGLNKVLTSDATGLASWTTISSIVPTNLDNDPTNEIQTISKAGSTVTLSNGGGFFIDSDTQLTEAQVDAFTNNNGYLTSFTEIDGSITNELQTIARTGTTATLSNGGGSFSINDADANPTNEMNTAFTLTGNLLKITDASGTLTVDLTPIISSTPSGAIVAFPTAIPPTGYLACNGQAVSRTVYSGLFSVLGISYGTGDGITTFNLPNYNGQFLRGWDNGQGIDLDAATRTNRGDGTSGDAVGTKQSNQTLAHAHSIDPPNTNSTTTGSHAHNIDPPVTNSNTTGSHAHIVNPPNTATTTNGNHTHNTGFYHQVGNGSNRLRIINGRSTPVMYYTQAAGNHNHTVNIAPFNSSSAGNHNHTVNIAPFNSNSTGSHLHSTNIAPFNSAVNGGLETRPTNVSVLWCIKF